MEARFGQSLRNTIQGQDIVPFIGVYDVFSSSIAAKHYNGLFLSGFSFSASYYGLPDIGLIAWSELVAFAQRVRSILPFHHLLVDIDDGYGDPEVACHVVALLELVGASGVVIEDQKRPKTCGHLSGKQLLELDEFVDKLKRVLATRENLFVVARTDATEREEQIIRAKAFAEAGADAVLVDALPDLQLIRDLKAHIDQPLVVNQIAGGQSPSWSLQKLQEAGVSMVNYSTPCLFAAQGAIEETMKELKKHDGELPIPGKNGGSIQECKAILDENLVRRDHRPS